MKILILYFLILCTGCSHVADVYIPKKITSSSNSSGYVMDEMIDTAKLTPSQFNGKEKLDERNAVIATGISLSDNICIKHKAIIMSNTSLWNFSAGSISMIFAGSAAVIDHAQTAAHLAAGAATVSGIQSLANKEMFANMLNTTILRAIDVSRAKSRAKLILGMSNENYSISQVIVDLQEYHDSCSLMAGLVEVTKALENRKLSSDELDVQIAQLQRSINELTSKASTSVNIPSSAPKKEETKTTNSDKTPDVLPAAIESIKELEELRDKKIVEKANAPE